MTKADGWVVRDIVARLRAQFGIYQWWEFERCAREHGIPLRYHANPNLPAAMHGEAVIDGEIVMVIYLRAFRSVLLTAKDAWHELAHLLGIPLNAAFWEARPHGEHIVARYERRAEEFARLFPDWEADLPPFFRLSFASSE